MCLLLALPGGAAAKTVVRACVSPEDAQAWRQPEPAAALDQRVSRAVGAAGGRIDLVYKPWRECLDALKDQTVDAVFPISYLPERSGFARFPMRDGVLDQSKRLMLESYSLYRKRGAAAQWDGRVLVADGIIAAQSGYSVVAQLQALGAAVDDQGRVADTLLRRLLFDEVVAAALLTSEGDRAMKRDTRLAAALERVNPPLAEKSYFIAFSEGFAARQGRFVEAVWGGFDPGRSRPPSPGGKQ